MLDAVALALGTGLLFGFLAVGMRHGFLTVPDAELGAFQTQIAGFASALVIAAVGLQLDDATWSGVWPFLVLGVISPGFTQVLFAQAVRNIGASRAMVFTGMIPLASGFAAVVFLDEPFRLALLFGTLLVVGGGMLLVWDRTRPPNYRAIGIAWALASIVFFAMRDNVSRWVTTDRGVPPLAAAAALLAGASVALGLYLLIKRGPQTAAGQMRSSVRPFIVPGLVFGIAYAMFLTALERGKVTIVSPLSGTFVLWTVVFSAIFMRKLEAISSRLVIAAILVLAGAAVVAATR
ncbi:MAG: DMT family transporter [Gaiellaceae bacterium]